MSGATDAILGGLAGMDGDKGTAVAAANDGVSAAKGTSVVDGSFPSNLVVGSVSILVIV